eukprot:4685748-Pyramimonas_sp.AAC.1
MRNFCGEMHDAQFDPKLRDHLSRLLFMKRMSAERDPAEGDADAADASQEETGRAILSVLRVRQQLLQSKGVVDMRRALADDQRRELVRSVRQEHE